MSDTSKSNDIPSILLVAIPKSAGVFIRYTLAQGLGLESVEIGSGHFPYAVIIHKPFLEFLKGGQIWHNHLDGSTCNRWYLKHSGAKVIVHMRDPRPVLLSWLHHIDTAEKHVRENPRHLWMCPVVDFGNGYFDLSQSGKLDCLVSHYGPIFVEWIDAWLDAEQSGDINMLMTTYDDFVDDRAKFIRNVLDFYEIPPNRFQDKHTDMWGRRQEYNFRSGDNDEWRTTLSRDQQRRLNAMIPRRILRRFGWPEE